jgi:DUF1016 N-terminal domain/YhcG PDDEXK nuclease domain
MKPLLNFYEDINKILLEARQKVYTSINAEMVMAYWRIGKRIIEEEQSGEKRAEYGAFLVKQLSDRLTKEFGKGFSVANVWNFRQFYLIFPENEILYAVRRELTWTHYKLGELTHQDIGQMDMYVRMFEDLHTSEGDNSTIGIILCAEKDQALVKYSVLDENKQIFATKYKLVLPTPEELKAELEREIHFLRGVQENRGAHIATTSPAAVSP